MSSDKEEAKPKKGESKEREEKQNKTQLGDLSDNSEQSKIKNNLINKKRSRSSSKAEEDKIQLTNQEIIKTKINSIINEKNPNKINYPSFDVPLISIAVFNELQANILPQDIISKEYNEYKAKYESKKNSDFYFDHQNDEWFKEKYDPEVYVKWRSERNTQAKKLSQQFLDSYKEIISSIKLELNPEDEFNKNIKIVIYTCNKDKTDFEEKERDITKMINSSSHECNILSAPYYGFDPDKMTLFIHQLPKNISRWQILEVAKKVPGFISLSLSEPIKTQNYSRFCWLSFENEEKCENAYEILKDFAINAEYKIHPNKSKSTTIKKIRLTPPLFDERVDEDLESTRKLIQIFDKDKEIFTNSIFDEISSYTKETQLDIQILYLRRVHGFCFYCLKEFDDERNLATKCDNTHLRNYKKIGSRNRTNDNKLSVKEEAEFDQFFKEKLKELFKRGIVTQPPKFVNSEEDEELKSLRENFCKNNTKQVSEGRFKCLLCNKLFVASNFVFNHISKKHESNINDAVDKKYFDRMKRENYFNDSNKCFEKIKIISSMEEYLNYITSIKKNNENKHKDGYSNNSKSIAHREKKDFRERKKRPMHRDYVDLDNPDGKRGETNKNIVSYDDL